MNDIAALTPILSVVATALGGAITVLVAQKTKRMQKELETEQRDKQRLDQKMDRLERKNEELAGHIEALAKQLLERTSELREVRWRYEALLADHEALKEAYKASELANQRLKDAILTQYMEQSRKTPVPPPPYPGPHRVK